MRFIKKRAGLFFYWAWLWAVLAAFAGCASATGLGMRLDYSNEAAAALTRARIERELSAQQQAQFYQAAVFLSVRHAMQLGERGAHSAVSAITSGKLAMWMSGAGQQAPAAEAFPVSFADFQARFDGRTPRQVIEQARREGAFKEGDLLQVMPLFLQQLAQ